jgi:hypothetical protein
MSFPAVTTFLLWLTAVCALLLLQVMPDGVTIEQRWVPIAAVRAPLLQMQALLDAPEAPSPVTASSLRGHRSAEPRNLEPVLDGAPSRREARRPTRRQPAESNRRWRTSVPPPSPWRMTPRLACQRAFHRAPNPPVAHTGSTLDR